MAADPDSADPQLLPVTRKRGRPASDQTILDTAKRELYARLENPVRAAEISDAVLVKVIRDFSEIQLKQEEAARKLVMGVKQLPAAKTVNVIQLVEQPGLPLARRVELLHKAIERARSEGDDTAPLELALSEVSEG